MTRSDKLLGVLVDFYSKSGMTRLPRMDEMQEMARQDYDEIESFIVDNEPLGDHKSLKGELYDLVYGVNGYNYFINTWR